MTAHFLGIDRVRDAVRHYLWPNTLTTVSRVPRSDKIADRRPPPWKIGHWPAFTRGRVSQFESWPCQVSASVPVAVAFSFTLSYR